MTRINIINALQSTKLHDWFNDNAYGLIAGKNASLLRSNDNISYFENMGPEQKRFF